MLSTQVGGSVGVMATVVVFEALLGMIVLVRRIPFGWMELLRMVAMLLTTLLRRLGSRMLGLMEALIVGVL